MKLFEVTNTTCMRKSANCKAQIRTMCGVNDTDLCIAICRLSHAGCVCHLEQLHAQSPFLFPIVFSINSFADVPPGHIATCAVLCKAVGLCSKLTYYFYYYYSRSSLTHNIPDAPTSGLIRMCFSNRACQCTLCNLDCSLGGTPSLSWFFW